MASSSSTRAYLYFTTISPFSQYPINQSSSTITQSVPAYNQFHKPSSDSTSLTTRTHLCSSRQTAALKSPVPSSPCSLCLEAQSHVATASPAHRREHHKLSSAITIPADIISHGEKETKKSQSSCSHDFDPDVSVVPPALP
jgi:hypothetical protein